MASDLLLTNCESFGISLTDKQVDMFERYYHMLIDWNEKINLTAITEYDEVMIKHFVDSLSIVKAIDLSDVHSMIDIGTGAGFPGIPIAIVFPNIKITLLDSLNKRINYLNSVISELGLDNVVAIHGRAEDIAKTSHRETYDLCVSRAVANLSTLSELCIPFVKCGGKFISYKAEKAEAELEEAKNAIKILGGEVEDLVSFSLCDSTYERNLIVIKKICSTLSRYPRKAGTPSKQPLV